VIAVHLAINLPAKNLKRVTTYIEPVLYSELEKLATGDKRSISQMAAILIEEGLERAKQQGKINTEESQNESGEE
jgi:hypothetical protein